jgi:hypothetical protein
MIRKAIFAISLAAALPLAAQSVTQASPGIMRFDDSTYQVSFRYPATWTFTEEATWMFALSIQPSPSSESQLRGRIFTHALPGIGSWPRTSFSGVEFGYDARPTASAEACRALAFAGFHAGKVEQVTLHNIPYWHGTAGDGGMSQSTSDDIYTTFIGPQTGGTCLLFDLAVHEVLAPGGDTAPRAFTPRERSIIHLSLMDVLSSVRIPAPPR